MSIKYKLTLLKDLISDKVGSWVTFSEEGLKDLSTAQSQSGLIGWHSPGASDALVFFLYQSQGTTDWILMQVDDDKSTGIPCPSCLHGKLFEYVTPTHSETDADVRSTYKSVGVKCTCGYNKRLASICTGWELV